MRPLGSNAYQHLHKQIVIRLHYFYIMTFNAIPASKCISEQFVPREIVTGKRFNLKHSKAPFGEIHRGERGCRCHKLHEGENPPMNIPGT